MEIHLVKHEAWIGSEVANNKLPRKFISPLFYMLQPLKLLKLLVSTRMLIALFPVLNILLRRDLYIGYWINRSTVIP